MIKKIALKKAIWLFGLIMVFGILSACGGGKEPQRRVEVQDVGQEAAEMGEGNEADEQAAENEADGQAAENGADEQVMENEEAQTESVLNDDGDIAADENLDEGTDVAEEPFDWSTLYVASEEDFEWEEISPEEVAIKGYLGSETNIKVPATLDGKAVVAISNGAFDEYDKEIKLRSIDFRDTSLRYIGQGAFSNCFELERVALPDMPIGGIETNPFRGCISLSEIILGEGSELELVDGMVYDGTTLILRLPAFADTDVIIREGTTEIGDEAFLNNNVVNVVMPDSVVSVDGSIFSQCTGLESITLSLNLTYISGGMFDGCRSLKEITIPEGVEEISGSAFFWCDSMENVKLPSTLTKIGGRAFGRCEALKDISIPASVTSIGESAFSNCHSLTDVYYGGSEQEWNMALGENVFESIENDSGVIDVTVHYNQ